MSKRLRFGTGGLPHTTRKGGGVEAGIERLAELGLDHLELEFVRNVFVKADKAPAIKKVAEENDVTLSAHGSYFVNLASDEKDKWHAGINRIVQAAVIGDLCGVRSVTYHSGFKQKKTDTEVFDLIKLGTSKILEEMEYKTREVRISPELTGKPAQYGSIEELVKLVKALREEGYGSSISLCVDFAHNYAREAGKYNSYDEVMSLLTLIEKELGSEDLDDLHIHMSAIEYGDKGEKNHLLYLSSLEEYKARGVEVLGIEAAFNELPAKRLEANRFKWEEVFKALKAAEVGGFVVCESPILELDALLMQTYYRSL